MEGEMKKKSFTRREKIGFITIIVLAALIPYFIGFYAFGVRDTPLFAYLGLFCYLMGYISGGEASKRGLAKK